MDFFKTDIRQGIVKTIPERMSRRGHLTDNIFQNNEQYEILDY